MKVSSHGATDVGRLRAHNEDAVAMVPERGVFIVADGLGGHNGGEVASRLAIDTIVGFVRMASERPDMTWPFEYVKSLSKPANIAIASIKVANLNILNQAAKAAELQGMGSTVVVLYLGDDQRAYLGHLGDSRIYRYRDGVLEQLTDDHSLVNEQMRQGILTPEEAARSPYRNVISRACGIRPDIEPDIRVEMLKKGDIFLLCSDGLTGPVNDAEIAETLGAKSNDLPGAAKSLIDRANELGGPDNITVGLVRVDEV